MTAAEVLMKRKEDFLNCAEGGGKERRPRIVSDILSANVLISIMSFIKK